MEDFFSRSEALLGAEAMEALRNKRVILFGVGGVGSWAAEALIRTGLVHLTVVDGDTVQPSNINRQLPATQATLGQPKVFALRERLLAINPDADIVAVPEYYRADSPFNFQLSTFHYLIDAIDSVPDKTHLLINASRVRALKIFSSMGAALRSDPTKVTTGELMSVKGDALAKAVRERMKKLGTHPNKKIRCVYSTEPSASGQVRPASAVCPQATKQAAVKGSLMQVTAVFGCTLASLVIGHVRSNCRHACPPAQSLPR